ncbi:MAG: glutamate mutase L [Anaerolineae bacterium]|nr:glutamate mutase L [Anaerolineae bacterium]
MTKTSLVDADSLLALEVGSVNTHASLFDMVADRYRFLASGSAASTAEAPMLDIIEGARSAITQLSSVSGRKFIDSDDSLIIPTAKDGAGVDRFVGTISAGEPLKVLAVGLLKDVSLESTRKLIDPFNAVIVDTFSLNDLRSASDQIDAFLRHRPDLVVVTGGSNNGASKSVLELVNTLRMALDLQPSRLRPEVLYAGNEAIVDQVQTMLASLTSFSSVPNVRPSLDVENLIPAETRLVEISRRILGSKILGVQDLDTIAKGHFIPTSIAYGRVVRFLSRLHDSRKGVLGVDIGASTTTIAAAFGGELNLDAYTGFGIGEGLKGLLSTLDPKAVLEWVPFEINEGDVTNYIYNKTIYPSSLPATPEDLAIEHALARQVVRTALNRSKARFPEKLPGPSDPERMPWFEPILVGGSVITQAASLAQSLLLALDSIEPTGISRLILDKNSLAPALGVAAGINSLLSVQVLESNAFLNFGTVISPVGRGRTGIKVLRLKIVYSSGQENTIEVRNGEIVRVPLPIGAAAQVHLQPLNRFDVGMGGPGKSGRLNVVGGHFGLLVDARGRPVRLPKSINKRRQMFDRWYSALSD